MRIKDIHLDILDSISSDGYYKYSDKLGPIINFELSIGNESWNYINEKDIIDSLKNKIQNQIKIAFIEDLKNSEIIDYIYCDLDDHKHIMGLFDVISIHDPKFIILSPSSLSLAIEEMAGNRTLAKSHRFNLGNTVINIDPLLHRENETMYLFDSIEINLKDVKFFDRGDQNDHINKHKFGFCIKIENPRRIVVVTSDKSKHWNDWIKLNRNNKINKIVNGDEN